MSRRPRRRAKAPPRPSDRIVIVVDDLHLAREPSSPRRQALLRFVAEQVSRRGRDRPRDDQLARRPPAPHAEPRRRCGTRSSRISSRENAAMAAARGSQMTPAQAELILRGDQHALRLATRSADGRAGERLTGASPRATVEATDGATPAGLDPGEKAAAREAQREATAVLAGALRFSEMTLATRRRACCAASPRCPGASSACWCRTASWSARARARSGPQLLRQVSDAATRSGAVVYALDTRGLAPSGADASVSGPVADPGLRERVARLASEESRATLAAPGRRHRRPPRARDSNDARRPACGRMLADNEAYYLMAYEPANTKRDGRFRKIELRLPRPPGPRGPHAHGLPRAGRSQARRPQAASSRPQLPPLVASPRALDEAAVRAALARPLPANGVPGAATADYLDLPPDGPQAIVQAHVDVARAQLADRRRPALQPTSTSSAASTTRPASPWGCRSEGASSWTWGPPSIGGPAEEGVRYAAARSARARPLRGAAWSPASRQLAHARAARASGSRSPTSATKKLDAQQPLRLAAAGGAPEAGARDEALRDAQLVAPLQAQRHRSTSSSTSTTPSADATGATDVVLQAQIRSGKPTRSPPRSRSRSRSSRRTACRCRRANGMSLDEPGAGRATSCGSSSWTARPNATAFRSVDFTRRVSRRVRAARSSGPGRP